MELIIVMSVAILITIIFVILGLFAILWTEITKDGNCND